jgi:hypothetical protein
MKKSDKVPRGALCCDHCSDSKFPCAYIDRRMKNEGSRGNRVPRGEEIHTHEEDRSQRGGK